MRKIILLVWGEKKKKKSLRAAAAKNVSICFMNLHILIHMSLHKAVHVTFPHTVFYLNYSDKTKKESYKVFSPHIDQSSFFFFPPMVFKRKQ